MKTVSLLMEEESNKELAFLISTLYIGSLRIITNIFTSALTTKQVVRKVFFCSLFNGALSIITIKNNLTKQNAKIKQLLKENDVKKALIANNHSLSHS